MRGTVRRIQLFAWRNPLTVIVSSLAVAGFSYALWNEAEKGDLRDAGARQERRIDRVIKVIPCLKDDECRRRVQELRRERDAPAGVERAPAPTGDATGTGAVPSEGAGVRDKPDVGPRQESHPDRAPQPAPSVPIPAPEASKPELGPSPAPSSEPDIEVEAPGLRAKACLPPRPLLCK